MSPIQQMLLGVGAVAKKTYVDDVFSTYLYKGNDSNIAVNNGIDISTEGGLVWIKNRDTAGYGHFFFDTLRGTTKALVSHGTNAEFTEAKGVHTFSTNGFTIGGSGGDVAFNSSGVDYASWTFRKAPGFFTIKEYTGTGSSQAISHDLASMPGLILVKRTNTSGGDWIVYHRDLGTEPELGQQKYLVLNGTNAAYGDGAKFSAAPTATTFSVGTSSDVNGSGNTYIAYLFAGGESTAATARSVVFDGDSSNHDDELHPPSSLIPSGRDSNKFCLETWLKVDATNHDGMIYGQYVGGNAGRMFLQLQNSSSPYNVRLFVGGSDAINLSSAIKADTWYHLAWTYDGTTHRMFVNGELKGTIAGSSLAADIVQSTPRIGGINETGYNFPGQLSNFRVVHDQAVYTASFKPSVTPLTTTSQGVSGSNCKVLCCNNSNILNNDGALAALTNPDNGTITASTDSPFDDPAAFTFGDAGDQNAIKTGSYVGTGSAGIEVNIGFEPQLILVKSTASGENWEIYDSMRGIVDGLNQSDRRLRPNTTDSEDDNPGFFSLRPNGFIVHGTSGSVNQNGVTFVFLAIRRPDGYVGTLAEAGTDVFTIVAGRNSPEPTILTNFVTDFGFFKYTGGSENWWSSARLLQGKNLSPNTDGAATSSNRNFDYNDGWDTNGGLSGYHCWSWKRHAGMDVICYEGDGVNGRSIAHSMNDVPEMMIVKRRSSTEDWTVYHTGLTSVNYHLTLNSEGNQVDMTSTPEKVWKSIPTATHFEIGSHDRVNTDGEDYLALLFSSIDGISKIGSYSGNNSGQTITTGFQPRFIIIKQLGHNSWYTFDTVRGWSQNNQDWYLRLEGNYPQSDHVNDRPDDIGHPLSTGFYLKGDTNNDLVATNKTGNSYIYYCHA